MTHPSAPALVAASNLPAFLWESPGFERFNAVRAQLAVPGVLDASETRMARVLEPLRRDPESLPLPQRGHRCHVAEDWLNCFGLPGAWTARTLVCMGVRHALQTLFAQYVRTGERVLVPSDVYPVYLSLAREAGLDVTRYATLPQARWGGLDDSVDVVLVASPVKPRGGMLAAGERQALLGWLAGKPSRRVVLDAVYTFGTQLPEDVLTLYETGQALVLHSLSKGWARPLVAGIVLVGEADIARWRPVFQALDVDPMSLRKAQGLLRHDRIRPSVLAGYLREQQQYLAAALSARGVDAQAVLRVSEPGQYLFALQQDWQTLYREHNVLALPASVFGSDLTDWSVLSSLSALPAQTWRAQP